LNFDTYLDDPLEEDNEDDQFVN